MSLSLGEKLRQAREERGISISEVSEQTRISPLYLAAIENDDYKTLPGGIFNKGFVKSYAKYIGFDEQEALHEYSLLVIDREGREQEEFKSYRPEVLTDDRAISSMAPTVIFAVIILALMTGGILFLVNYIVNQPDDPNVATGTPTPSETAVNSPLVNSALPQPAQPATDRISIELKAVGEQVWTNYTVDGAAKMQTLEPDETVKVEAKNSFKISYSKAKIDNLQFTLNGKQITPPNTPKGTVEFEINKSNLAEILNRGAISAVGDSPAATPARTPVAETRTATPPTPEPGDTPRTRPTPRPTTRSTARIGTPIPTQTPIVVGRPRRATTNRPNPE